MISLTPEQVAALKSEAQPRIVNPSTKETFFLVDANLYARLFEILQSPSLKEILEDERVRKLLADDRLQDAWLDLADEARTEIIREATSGS